MPVTRGPRWVLYKASCLRGTGVSLVVAGSTGSSRGCRGGWGWDLSGHHSGSQMRVLPGTLDPQAGPGG